MEIKFSAPPLGKFQECRVFIPNDPGRFNLSDLTRFGYYKIEIFPYPAIFPDTGEFYEPGMVAQIKGALLLNQFNSDKDYVALIGDPIVNAATMFVIGRMVDKVTVLRFDGQARAYWPFTIRFNIGE